MGTALGMRMDGWCLLVEFFSEGVVLCSPLPGYHSIAEERGVEVPAGLLPVEQHHQGAGRHSEDQDVRLHFYYYYFFIQLTA